MELKIIIDGKELKLKDYDIDLNDSPHTILDGLVQALGEKIDPDFEGVYSVNKQVHF